MAIRSRKNQYIGVNAHLNSLLQNQTAEWPPFHSAHIIYLAEAIDSKLPPGYVVAPEQSLQIRDLPPAGPPTVRRLRPDIGIYQRAPAEQQPAGMAVPTASRPTHSYPTVEELDDQDMYFTSAVIYALAEGGGLARMVTRIELLSPGNKPHGSGYWQYREKRGATLRAGITLVEIDYLHQLRPVSERVPSYPDGEVGAYPYTVSVADPHPTLDEGETHVYGFSLDTEMPVVPIPLAAQDKITLELGAVYNQTYSRFALFSTAVDYAELPDRFETYSAADQARIRQRMTAVQQAHAHGANLEEGPFVI